jgi:hypothetical protein
MSLQSPYVKEMHERLRENYRTNGTDKPLSSKKKHPSECVCRDCCGPWNGTVATYPLPIPPALYPSLPGLEVLQKPRIGREMRDVYLNRLREAFAGEYISEAVFDARSDVMMSASTEEELKYLVRDLPQLAKAVPAVPETPKPAISPVSYFVWMTLLTAEAVMAGNMVTHVLLGLAALFWAAMFVHSVREEKKRNS